jgi:prolyl-tRNA synthetase
VLGAREVFAATDADVEKATGAPVGFAGPVGLKTPIYADLEIRGMANFVVGANAADAHYKNVNLGRDFEATQIVDLRTASPGDPCPRCDGGHYKGYRGIEVGHVFFLGTKYSAPMKCNVLDESGTEKPMIMGCYGIGVTRIAAAAIEQNHDDNGIIWPLPLAPFQVEIVSDTTNADCVKAADEIYEGLTKEGIEVLYDDREERMGPKFKDADLIGIPLRITVGKKSLAEGAVEFKHRRSKDAEKIQRADIVRKTVERVRAEVR